MEVNGKALLKFTDLKFPYYAPHEFYHVRNVERTLDWIIPNELKQRFNEYELFFLLAAIYLHDLGHIRESDEDPKDVHATYHLRTEDYLIRHHDRVGLSKSEGEVIGKICKGHGNVDLRDNEYEQLVIGLGKSVNIRFLSALLRLADELDVKANRIPEMLFYSMNPSAESDIEFKKCLRLVTLTRPENQTIQLFGVSRKPIGAAVLIRLRDRIQEVLDAVIPILTPRLMPLRYVELITETSRKLENISRETAQILGDWGYSYDVVNYIMRRSVHSPVPKKLLRQLKKGNVVLFVGSGINDYLGIPLIYELTRELAKDINVDRFLPTCKSWTSNWLPRIAELYLKENDRKDLEKKLIDFYDRHIDTRPPSKIHEYTARLPAILVVTTNYDDLLEEAFGSIGKRCVKMTTETTMHELFDTFYWSERREAILWKCHGSIDEPHSLVITDSDLVNFERSQRTIISQLAGLLVSKTILLLGFGEADMNFQRLYNKIWHDRRSHRKQDVYIVGTNIDELSAGSWGFESAKIINMSLDSFLTTCTAHLKRRNVWASAFGV